MQLTLNDVRRIARLARIAVSDAEAERALAQLSGVFGLIEQMQSVNTDGVEPMAHAREVTLRLREDRVTEPDRRGALQAVAPEVADGLYLVPRVIE